MYGVVMHDSMRELLTREFILVYGKTKGETAENAWNKLKSEFKETENYLSDLEFDDGCEVTKKSFIKSVINNEDNEDGVLISLPEYLYIKLFKIPEQK